jgi:pimeloyl-ACP methyl ester carboxylesterase
MVWKIEHKTIICHHQEFVLSIEKWREAMKIEKMILVAHSWGGFLASSYSLKYAEHVEHLLLVDPWGLDANPDMKDFPLWKLTVAYAVRLMVGCFTMVRVFGPFGNYLIKNVRPDLLEKYNSVCEPSVFGEYIYHCVNQSNPTGEAAFHKMTSVGPWPVNPIGERMKSLDEHLPLTFLYGSNSWTSKAYGNILKEHRVNSYTEFKIIPQAGHHVYTDNPHDFHRAVLDAAEIKRSNLKKKSN